MKSLMLAGSLIGVLVIMAAFKNLQDKQAMKKIQTTENSKGFAVVELFTSEGCSSCPPADELVEKIQQDNKNRQIYILAFHVDYWDHQGWRDKFSDHQFSERQRQYASWLGLRTIYTPQIVINGTSEHVGSDQGPILRTISRELDQPAADTLTLQAKVEAGKLKVLYKGVGEELVLALVQRSAHSNVRAGENSGRSLSHVQIVRGLQRVNMSSRKNISMDLPKDFNENGWELIGFVQQRKDGRITAATRVDL
ncbi:DUF1223 domain-containing protein [Chitinophaga niabensis]|uniref:DUF1223 domain-containing protein n=1 Tax=Chitinophaga niabensis TaxID=536979 RepID=UPI0031BAB428